MWTRFRRLTTCTTILWRRSRLAPSHRPRNYHQNHHGPDPFLPPSTLLLFPRRLRAAVSPPRALLWLWMSSVHTPARKPTSPTRRRPTALHLSSLFGLGAPHSTAPPDSTLLAAPARWLAGAACVPLLRLWRWLRPRYPHIYHETSAVEISDTTLATIRYAHLPAASPTFYYAARCMLHCVPPPLLPPRAAVLAAPVPRPAAAHCQAGDDPGSLGRRSPRKEARHRR